MKKIILMLILITLVLAFLNCARKEADIQAVNMNTQEKKLIGVWRAASPKINENAIWEFKKNSTLVTKTEAMTYEGYFKSQEKTITVTFPMKTVIYEIIEMTDNEIELKSKLQDMEVKTTLTKQN